MYMGYIFTFTYARKEIFRTYGTQRIKNMEIEKIIKEIFEGKYEVIKKEVKNFGTSGATYLHKKYVGKEVVIIIPTEKCAATATQTKK